ncbi:ribonuclease [Herbaspirillum lusitanum]|uniref:Ribonuclease n=1 Tax=Herbaspirillum lusitanum TaxID=213312 RepID=A0ABW9ACJ6_9BURK
MRASSLKSSLIKNWLVFLLGLMLSASVLARGPAPLDDVRLDQLPREAQQTMGLIKDGGPYPYAKDGAVFGNYEGVLPKQKRGYYHEFTVKTPKARNRGARRIISGGEPKSSGEYYYTSDHYATFRRIRD